MSNHFQQYIHQKYYVFWRTKAKCLALNAIRSHAWVPLGTLCKLKWERSHLIISMCCSFASYKLDCLTIFSDLLYWLLSPCRLLVSGTSTSSSVIWRHFSPWRSRTTRGQVWKVTQTLSCPQVRTTASPCPLTRKMVHIWPKVESSSSRLFPTATLTSSWMNSLNYWAELHITYACIIRATEKINYYFLNLREVFIFEKFFFFFNSELLAWDLASLCPAKCNSLLFSKFVWLFKYAF